MVINELNQSQRIVKVGFVSSFNPEDRKVGSGTIHKLYESLLSQNNLNVFWIPFKEPLWVKILSLTQRAINLVVSHLMAYDRSPFLKKYTAKGMNRKLISQADVLFCPWADLYIADKPIVYHSDAVYSLMISYYFSEPAESRQARIGDKLQQLVLDNASLLVFPSKWAADGATEFYHQSVDKIRILKYGPNIDTKDIKQHVFKYDGHLHILFSGVDWIRKGGGVAVDAVRWLNENGIPSTLHIVGIKDLPGSIKFLPFIDFVGFMNKNNANDYKRLIHTIDQCHCMLLPTKSECAGISFVEASAYGLPSFTHQTGGIPDYISNGINGYMLPLGSSSEDFGRKIKECLLNGEMERMSYAAVEYQRHECNYEIWGKKMAEYFENLIC